MTERGNELQDKTAERDAVFAEFDLDGKAPGSTYYTYSNQGVDRMANEIVKLRRVIDVMRDSLGSVPQEPPIQAQDASRSSDNEIITLLTQIRDELRSIEDAVWKAANERDPL